MKKEAPLEVELQDVFSVVRDPKNTVVSVVVSGIAA